MVRNVLSVFSKLFSKGLTPRSSSGGPQLVVSLEFPEEFCGSRSFEGELLRVISKSKTVRLQRSRNKKTITVFELYVECAALSDFVFLCLPKEYEKAKDGKCFIVLVDDGRVLIPARARVFTRARGHACTATECSASA